MYAALTPTISGEALLTRFFKSAQLKPTRMNSPSCSTLSVPKAKASKISTSKSFSSKTDPMYPKPKGGSGHGVSERYPLIGG